ESFAYSPPVAMAFRPFYVNRALRSTRQPLAARDGSLIAFDGRIDNLPEIRRLVGADASCSTPALALAVYRALDLEGLARIVGEFALATWSPLTKRLVLCCDHLGRRPLYYHWTRDALLWASQARPIAAAAGLAGDIDDEFV